MPKVDGAGTKSSTFDETVNVFTRERKKVSYLLVTENYDRKPKVDGDDTKPSTYHCLVLSGANRSVHRSGKQHFESYLIQLYLKRCSLLLGLQKMPPFAPGLFKLVRGCRVHNRVVRSLGQGRNGLTDKGLLGKNKNAKRQSGHACAEER